MKIIKTVREFLIRIVLTLLNTIYKIMQKSFANRYAEASKKYDLKVKIDKVFLFEKLREQKSKIPEMKKMGRIRVVELGAGTGPNLQFYPNNCSLLVVEPNPFFEPYFQKELKKYPGINFEGFKLAPAENMDFIQDESVDAVVVTAVGCSINDVQQVYKEVLRILVPGGKFYYLEHIKGRYGSSAYYKQKLAAMLYPLWKMITCNCHFDRDLDYQITRAGFSKVEQKLFEISTSGSFFYHFISPCLWYCYEVKLLGV